MHSESGASNHAKALALPLSWSLNLGMGAARALGSLPALGAREMIDVDVKQRGKTAQIRSVMTGHEAHERHRIILIA